MCLEPDTCLCSICVGGADFLLFMYIYCVHGVPSEGGSGNHIWNGCIIPKCVLLNSGENVLHSPETTATVPLMHWLYGRQSEPLSLFPRGHADSHFIFIHPISHHIRPRSSSVLEGCPCSPGPPAAPTECPQAPNLAPSFPPATAEPTGWCADLLCRCLPCLRRAFHPQQFRNLFVIRCVTNGYNLTLLHNRRKIPILCVQKRKK